MSGPMKLGDRRTRVMRAHDLAGYSHNNKTLRSGDAIYQSAWETEFEVTEELSDDDGKRAVWVVVDAKPYVPPPRPPEPPKAPGPFARLFQRRRLPKAIATLKPEGGDR